MGASFAKINELFDQGFVARDSLRILDIGTQNLYHATAAEIVRFIEKSTNRYDPDSLADYAEFLALGSGYFPDIGGINGSWLGDLLVRAGHDYVAYDIFEGFRTRLFDLNQDAVPDEHRGLFDLVLNFGTSEHVIGQRNCFQVIHEAAAVGGVMVHELPHCGFLDHGYFNYQPSFFQRLAGANDYEILALSVSDGDASEPVPDSWDRSFPGGSPAVRSADNAPISIPTRAVEAVLRKTKDAPFRPSLFDEEKRPAG